MKNKTVIILLLLGCGLMYLGCGNAAQRDTSYFSLNGMGSDQGYDRKKVVQFVRDSVGIVGNMIFKVDVAAKHAVIEIAAGEANRLKEFAAQGNKLQLTAVDKADFHFSFVSPKAVATNAANSDHPDHYGSDGPHGSGEGHSGDRAADPCHDR